MKKKMEKIIATLLVAAMALMTLAGCGNTDVPANATIESANDTTNDANETPIEDGIVESGTLDNVPSTEENVEDVKEDVVTRTLADEGIMYDYTKAFGLKEDFNTTAEATDFVNPYVEDPTNARHFVTYKDIYGNVMEYTFVAPTSLQGAWAMVDNTFTIFGPNRTYRLRMWYGGMLSNEADLMKNTNEETIVDWSAATPIDGTFQVEENEDFYRVIFKIIDGDNMGYAVFIDYYDLMECYQFEYLVEKSLFDEDEALAVVKSIEYYRFEDIGLVAVE